MKNNRLIFIIIVLNVFLNLLIVSSTITRSADNGSYDVQSFYRPGNTLVGSLNISVSYESNDTYLATYFGPNRGPDINLRQLLGLNGVNVECWPQDCLVNLSIIGEQNAKDNPRIFRLNKDQSKLFGFKITGVGQAIDQSYTSYSINFNISSDAGDSCKEALKFDILDDQSGSYEYEADSPSNEFCEITRPMGNYEPSSSTTPSDLVLDYQYCENTLVPAFKNYYIGANLTNSTPEELGSNPYQFDIELKVGGTASKCNGVVPKNGMLNCTVDAPYLFTGITNVTVCIKPIKNNGDVYKIKSQTNDPSGFALDESGNKVIDQDMPIFIFPLKYKAVGNYKFNISAGSSGVDTYISSRYNNNCTPYCIIPIRVSSGIDNQEITIYDLNIRYREGLTQKNASIIGDLVSSPPVIGSRGYKNISLNALNIPIPNNSGSFYFILKNGNNELIKANITVANLIDVSDVIPKEPVALFNNSFFAIFDSPLNTSVSYEWTFGNASPIRTTSPSVKYIFSSTGPVTLNLKIISNQGNTTKTFLLNVLTPDQGFNRTLQNYRTSLNNFAAKISNTGLGISDFAKTNIDGEDKQPINLKQIAADLNTKEKKYREKLDSESSEKLNIIKDLVEMKIPSDLEITQIIGNTKYISNENKIDFTLLEEAGAGSIEGDETSFKKRLNSWISDNLDLRFDSKTYRVRYLDGSTTDLFSDMTFTLDAKKFIEPLYFIIDSGSSADKVILSNPDLKAKESNDNTAIFITFQTLNASSTQRIEFLYPNPLDITDLPVYVSPDFNQIGGISGVDTGNCNHNGRCDDNEDYKECPGDCKPWSLAIILIVVVFFIALFVYILMQEWYKKHYESYLFTNKTQLYNLINFMYNSSNQGNSKSIVISKLKDSGWSGEQLEYAWRKFKGERVGLWEIPVFKWAENKKVKNELIKRNPQISKNTVIR